MGRKHPTGSHGPASARICLVASRPKVRKSRLALVSTSRRSGPNGYCGVLRDVWARSHVGSIRSPFAVRDLGHGPTAKDFFAHPPVVAIPFSLLNPFFEELIVRAYLMAEVIELTGSSTMAVALSVGVQFSYHLYYGWVGAISLSFFFLALALYYVRSRCAFPVIVAHGFLDVYALIRLW